MDPEVEPAPTSPPVLAAELGRSLVVLLCGALGVVPWLPALGVLEDPAALPWVCALGAAGSALAAALVGGWTARRTPDGVGGGVVAGAATAALSWTLGAAPVVAAWAGDREGSGLVGRFGVDAPFLGAPALKAVHTASTALRREWVAACGRFDACNRSRRRGLVRVGVKGTSSATGSSVLGVRGAKMVEPLGRRGGR